MKTTVGVIKFFSKEKNIMVVKLFKKTTSIIVALLLIFSLIGIAGYKVLASTDKAYAGTDLKASIEIETENYNITVPGFALDEYLINDIIGFFPWPKAFELTKDLLQFAVPRILPQYKKAKPDPYLEMLGKVLEQQEETIGVLNSLGNKVANTEENRSLQNELENFKKISLNNSYISSIVINGLDAIEKDAEEKLKESGSTEMSQEMLCEMADKRISLLTDEINAVGNCITADIDEAEDSFYRLLTDKHFITINGEHKEIALPQVFSEYARMDSKFLWEHEAYDILDTFYKNVLMNYLIVYTVENLSLQARSLKIEKLQQVDLDNNHHRSSLKVRYELALQHYNDIMSKRNISYKEGGFKVDRKQTRHFWSRANGANCDYYFSGYEAEVNPIYSEYGTDSLTCKDQVKTNTRQFARNCGLNGGQSPEPYHYEAVAGGNDKLSVEDGKPNDWWKANLYRGLNSSTTATSTELGQMLLAGKGQSLYDILYRAWGGEYKSYNSECPCYDYLTNLSKDCGNDKLCLVLPYDDPNFQFKVNKKCGHHSHGRKDGYCNWDDYEYILGCTHVSMDVNNPVMKNNKLYAPEKDYPIYKYNISLCDRSVVAGNMYTGAHDKTEGYTSFQNVQKDIVYRSYMLGNNDKVLTQFWLKKADLDKCN